MERRARLESFRDLGGSRARAIGTTAPDCASNTWRSPRPRRRLKPGSIEDSTLGVLRVAETVSGFERSTVFWRATHRTIRWSCPKSESAAGNVPVVARLETKWQIGTCELDTQARHGVRGVLRDADLRRDAEAL